MQEYSDLLSDVYYTYGIDASAKLMAKASTGNVYNYV